MQQKAPRSPKSLLAPADEAWDRPPDHNKAHEVNVDMQNELQRPGYLSKAQLHTLSATHKGPGRIDQKLREIN